MASSSRGMSVGTRVLVDSWYLASVRYVGPVANHTGIYLGVEYDDPSRGRHNGTVDGTTYFTCVTHPSAVNAASLVRPKKVVRIISVLEAVVARYRCTDPADQEGALAPAPASDDENTQAQSLSDQDSQNMHVLTSSEQQVPVDFVGRDEVARRFDDVAALRGAFVPDANVGYACEPPGSLAAAAPNLAELDASGGLFSDWWVDVTPIAAELVRLETLNVSRAPLMHVPTPAPMTAPTFAALRVLVLNTCPRVTWCGARAICASCPQLEELHLCANGWSTLQLDGGEELAPHTGVRVLNLDDNALSDWNDVAVRAHAAFPHLVRLSANGNQFASVAPFQQGCLASLESLLVGRNALADWACLDALDTYPKLEEARLSDNPWGGAPATVARSAAVARISRLARLNGSTVRTSERRDAEMRYARAVSRELAEMVASGTVKDADAALAAAATSHPRYAALCAAHDLDPRAFASDAAAAAASGGGVGALAAELMALRFTCVSARAGETRPFEKRLPASTSLHKVKAMCRKMFRLEADADLRLFAKAPGQPVPEPLAHADDDEDLRGAGLLEGSEILVDETE